MKLNRALMLSVAMGVLCAWGAQGEDIITRRGDYYHDVEVTKVETDGIRVTHSDGVAKIPFPDLPDDLQKKYHYDPDALAKAAERKMVEQAQDLKKEQAAATAAAIAADEAAKLRQEQAALDKRRADTAADEKKRTLEETQRNEDIREMWLRRIKLAGGMLAALVVLTLLYAFYFLPTKIARRVSHPNARAIFLTNLLGGWLIVPWLVALAWARLGGHAPDVLQVGKSLK